MLKSISEKIDEVIESIFECKFNEVTKNTIEIVDYIENNIIVANNAKKEIWNKVLNYLIIGLENKDYLIVGDILKYEIKPILKGDI